jgi:hypothetical protein
MARRKSASTAVTNPAELSPPTAENKWAEPYRPVARNEEAGFEMGENKLTQQILFYFSADPGEAKKSRLKHYGYFYRAEQKAWTVNATPMTREIARRLADEFAAGRSSSSVPAR